VGSLASIALLFQSAHLDPGVTDAQAQTMFDAAREPKTLKWYDTAHDVLDIAAISDRSRFLAVHVGLKRIGAILKAKIGVRERRPCAPEKLTAVTRRSASTVSTSYSSSSRF